MLFGGGGSYDVDSLRLRAAILDEVKAEVELARQDLAALAAEHCGDLCLRLRARYLMHIRFISQCDVFPYISPGMSHSPMRSELAQRETPTSPIPPGQREALS